MDRRHYKNRMGNIEQLLGPEVAIIFFKDTIDFLRNI